MSRQALQAIYQHSWPGNVRELENALERAVIMTGDEIQPSDLPLAILSDKGDHDEMGLPAGLTITEAVEDLERRMIQRALAAADGVQAHAAESLGITKSNLAYKMKKYGISPPEAGAGGGELPA
jgi:two-component system NtrC family response regulator